MERLGIVVEKGENPGTARVQFRRHAMCGRCGQCAGAQEEEMEVMDPLGAARGDWVLVTTGEKNMFVLALGLYGLPLLTFIGGFVLGYGLWNEIVGGFLALSLTGLFFLGLRLKDKKLQKKEELQPRIKRLAVAREIEEWQ